MVDICEVLEHLIEEFEQINNKDFKICYVKVALPAKSSETDRKKVWSELWGDDESRSWPEYTQYPLFEREEDAKPSHIVYGALRDTNVTEGWQAIEGSIKKTVRQLLLRNYEPESMPDSDTFLDNFPKFTDTKVPIQQQGGEVYLWYELLLKLSQEQGAFIEGDLGLSGLCMSELPCATKIQGLKTDVLTASKLALQYLLDKAEQRSRQKEFTGADRNNLSQEKPAGTGQEIEPGKERKQKNRPTKAEMENRNRTVVMAVAEIKTKYDRLPTVSEIIEKTKLAADQIYATAPYKEGKIAKKSATLTTETTGGSVTASEQFGEKSIEHSRADRLSKSEQLERDRLIDESKEDDTRDEKQHKRYLRNKKGLTQKSIKN